MKYAQFLSAWIAATAMFSPLAWGQGSAGKLEPPIDVHLDTADGVTIVATFFPGGNEKESVPVILLHGYKGNRHDMDPLAKYLQEQMGCAVIAPDLRGHGDSVNVKNFDKKLDLKTMPPAQFLVMIDQDLEKVKGHLLQQNNEGKLNIDKLCVVGVEMGASLAMLWTIKDYSWPDLSIGKQGKDVKTLVLISPAFGFKNLSMQPALAHPLVRKLPMYMTAGMTDTKSAADLRRVYDSFKKFHTTADEFRPAELEQDENREKIDLVFDTSMATKLQGGKLLSANELKLNERIGKFIEKWAAKKPYPWVDRKNPYGG